MTLPAPAMTDSKRAESAATPRSEFAGVAIGVVIPAYGVEGQIERVIAGVPDFVRTIIVVEDASRDGTRERLRAIENPRLIVIEHERNRGVGGAMASGLERALQEDLDVVVKMDGDDQMDPAQISELVRPLVERSADMTKGNRYSDLEALRSMPIFRIIGNAGLTFLVKVASGHWSLFDPANGFFAIRSHVLRHMNLRKLPERYFFESGLLIKLGILRAVVLDVAIPARYADEKSSLSITQTLVSFPPKLLWGLMRRLFWRYLVYDFTALSLYLLLGVPALVGGVVYGVTLWIVNNRANEFAHSGQVMMAVLPIILGAQLVLQAIALDIANTPRTPISPPLKPRSGS